MGIPTVLHRFIQQLMLQVARVWDRKFLGYSFWVAMGRQVKRRVAPKSMESFKQRVRQITSRNGGRSLERVCEELGQYLRGWLEYFALADFEFPRSTLPGLTHVPQLS